MKNLLIVATSTLFVLTVIAVPLPSATNDDVKIVQIPLDGNKVTKPIQTLTKLTFIYKYVLCHR